MYPKVEPRPVTCTTCGQPHVHPRVMRVNNGKNIVNEAHWICPKCSNRFMVGTISIEPGENKKN